MVPRKKITKSAARANKSGILNGSSKGNTSWILKKEKVTNPSTI